jgi:hypothetical protein
VSRELTPDQARARVEKLRRHASLVDGTPEAAMFRTRANELAAHHGLSVTTESDHPAPARPQRSGTTTQTTKPTSTPRRTNPMNTTKAKPSRPASDSTMKHAFTPRTRAAFGRNTPPGTEVTGYIVVMEEEPDLDFHTKAPKLNPDGTERMVPVLIIQTDGTTRPYGQGLRKLWVRSGIADALIGACMDAGATRTAVGGKVRIRFEGLGEPPAPSFAAPKLYSASYEPPVDQEAC